MKKNEEVYGDCESCMYPFSNWLSMNLSSAASSACVMGYTLQFIESETPGLNTIVWLHLHRGGKRRDSSSLNSATNCRYSFGITGFIVCCLAATTSSTVALLIMGGPWCDSSLDQATVVFWASVER